MKNSLKTLIAALCLTGIVCVASSGCNGAGVNIKPLEQMTELEYSKWKLYIQLGVKIGANRLIQEEITTREQLNIAATVIEGISSKPVTAGAKSLIIPALEDAGFNNDEVQLILLIAEQELLARGALDWINPETGLLELSPRTREVLSIIAGSLRTADKVTPAEKNQSEEMKADFSRSE